MSSTGTRPTRRRDVARIRGFAAVITLAALSVSGCGSTTTTQHHRSRLASTPSRSFASTVQAREIPPNTYRPIPYGTVVPETAIVSPREFTDSEHGVALIGGEKSPTAEGFAVTTNDGGHTWRIDSPVFFAPVADGQLAVSDIGSTNTHTFFAWGGGGSVVDGTSDGGRHWWQAFLSSNIVAVTPNVTGDLVAIVQNLDSRPGDPGSVTGVYVSTNSGRSWQLTTQPAEG